MSNKVLVKEVVVGDEIVSLFMQDQIPVVECRSQKFTNVWLLVDYMQVLSYIDYVTEFAQISNFFWKGTQFQFIESIIDYQKYYIERIELERQNPADVFEYRLTDFKIFDISVMHLPKVEQNQLSYFVYNVQTGLPYRVVCPFPYTSSPSTFVHYQLLPIID